MFVFRGEVVTQLPHPSLEQFSEERLLDVFFSPNSNEGNGTLNKWFYFYCNPVLDPVVLTVTNNSFHLHPGLKRFIGTSLRQLTKIPAWIISDVEIKSVDGINVYECVYEGNDPESWINENKNTRFLNSDIRYYIKRYLKNKIWELELPDGRVFYLNPILLPLTFDITYITKGRWRVSDNGLITAIQEMFQECYKDIEPPVDDMICWYSIDGSVAEPGLLRQS